MTYRELFESLLAKNYQPHPCEDHPRGPYCCVRGVYDDAELAENDPARAEDLLRDLLDLDRREVFRVWFNDPDMEGPGHVALMDASRKLSEGELTTCVEYLLQQP